MQCDNSFFQLHMVFNVCSIRRIEVPITAGSFGGSLFFTTSKTVVINVAVKGSSNVHSFRENATQVSNNNYLRIGHLKIITLEQLK